MMPSSSTYGENGSTSIESGIGNMRLEELDSTSRSNPTSSGHHSGEDAASSVPIRKADLPHNHIELATRPGECKVARMKMDVWANYLRLLTPDRLQAFCTRVEFRIKGRMGPEVVTKKEKAEPLFWSLYQQRKDIFPCSYSRIVYDGVGQLYSLDKLNIQGGNQTVEFFKDAAAARGGGGGGRGGRGGGRGGSRAPERVQCQLTVIPMLNTADLYTSDEAIRCSIIQLLDLIITQEMRCPLVANASRFIQNGHSLFRVPEGIERNNPDIVKCIGNGEEIWTGLHMAVKADAPGALFLNANTSGSIFYTPNLNMVDFYAQVMHGYTIPMNQDTSRLTINPRDMGRLADALKGTKVRVQKPDGSYGTKKFDRFSDKPASALVFQMDDGPRLTVAEYFIQYRGIRLAFPHLPCLQFFNKVSKKTMYYPMEVTTTGDEPRKFKGKLTDVQLNAFIKAVGMGPTQKRALINKLTGKEGGYLGRGEIMREWGVGVEREMVKIEQATVMPLPEIKWKDDRSTRVNPITGEYEIFDEMEGRAMPRKMLEIPKKSLALVLVFINAEGSRSEMDPHGRMSTEEVNQASSRIYNQQYREHADLFMTTLRRYGLDVLGPAFTFQHLLDNRNQMNLVGLREMLVFWKNDIARIGREQSKDFAPLFMFVFPRRFEKLYAAIKYACDVDSGVLSQCILKRTFEKFVGNAVTNTSAQNVLLKVLAKAGGVSCRIDGNQFRNVGRMTTPEEPTLVLGIDVSHPSREERQNALEKGGMNKGAAIKANQNRGRHEQLPTARPAAANLFKEFSFHDCPRSVMAVVGNTDLMQTKWGVSSRVQRLGQEETVNLLEPFKARIAEFHKKTGHVPKHIIVYRDGVSDTQFKKAVYDETTALEAALATFGIARSDVTISYICAKKRHHTRFFAVDPNKALNADGRPGYNTPPGLLIEREIINRNNFDFFVQSHYGALGTASPTHYTVLQDDWKPSTSFWQTVIFAHCFCNSRSPKPLSIPVPLHYAHFAAKRAKNHFDHFRDFSAPPEYFDSKEDLAREQMETDAITVNASLSDMDSMYYA